MASFTFVREVAAPPEVVFDVLSDHRGFAKFTPSMRRSTLEREGEPGPNGVGAIRVFTFAGPLREEVLTYEPPMRLSYTMLSGAPLRDHVGTLELTPSGTGTRFVYAVRTTPTLPLVGPAVVAVARRAVKQLVNGIVAESERRAAG
jgi:uncharacterized protein YndB with AHSA1/START domain